MLIGGLWHGANWTFVVWGAIHGSMLALERFMGKTSAYAHLTRPARTAATFFIVCLAWVFFRADNFHQALSYLESLFALRPVLDSQALAMAPVYTAYHATIFAIAALLVWAAPNSWAVSRRISPAVALCAAALFVVSVMLMWTQTENPFIYFQF
jgi:alginate O-acetyltransferase complex protein AlgI